ncbi:MAG: mycothiol synthase [Actinomycetes bacterium]
MSAPRVRTCPSLPAGVVAAVLLLVEAAEAEDGVRPVNEAAELRLRASDVVAPGVVHLLHGGAGRGGAAIDVDGDDPGELRGYAQVSGTAGDQPEVELAVHPAHRRKGVGTALLQTAGDVVAGQVLRGWAHGNLPAAQALAASQGYEAVRGLLRMRLDDTSALPDLVVPDGVRIRGFEPGRDEQAWLAVNARAFSSHPEQGRWTAADLSARMVEPWFEPAGFLLAEDVATGQLLGFHWTKVEGDVGEVYVVGVDPAAQGRRLGSVLTLAGLHHLRDRGMRVVDLYVESDNAPALTVYRRLGFTAAAEDVMYARRTEDRPARMKPAAPMG